MKILIIQTAFIGDVVLATSLLEKLHAKNTDTQIHFLLRKGNEGLLHEHPFINKVWIWDKKSNKYSNWFRLLISIRKEKFDVVVNCQRFGASGLLTGFSSAKEKTGFAKNPFSFLFTKKYPHVIGKRADKVYAHEIDRNQQLISKFTDEVAALPKLYPSPTDIEQIKSFVQEPFITISPASVWFTKQFPKVKWLELINKIPSSYNIYLLGGGVDKTFCDEIIELSARKNTLNLAGELSFLQTAALMKQATMNYTNDSAPLHFASAMDAPVTAVFCSTIPQFGFGPLSKQYNILQEKENLYCRPCGLHGRKTCPEKHFKCAGDISVENFLLQ